jgi:hypothetical protein
MIASRAPCSSYHGPIPAWSLERIEGNKRRARAGETEFPCPCCGVWLYESQYINVPHPERHHSGSGLVPFRAAAALLARSTARPSSKLA